MADDASRSPLRVLVLGATGNLGSALVERLVERSDVQVVAVARRLPEPDARDERVEYRAADITTDDLDALVTGVDAVVHLAWAIQPMHDPHRTWQINTGGTARLLTALERAGTRVVVHASSIGAYPPAADDRRVDETTPPSGIGHVPYSVQKAYDEALLDAFELRTTCRVVRLRPALVLQRAAGAEYEGLFLGALGSRALGALRRLRAPLPLPRDLRFAVVAAHDVAAPTHKQGRGQGDEREHRDHREARPSRSVYWPTHPSPPRLSYSRASRPRPATITTGTGLLASAIDSSTSAGDCASGGSQATLASGGRRKAWKTTSRSVIGSTPRARNRRSKWRTVRR